MRHTPRSCAIHVATLALALLAFADQAAAQDATGTAFVAQLRQAAARPDGEALADLTQLPFLFDSQPQGREAFIQRVVPALFTPRVRQCLQRATPQAEDGRLVLWCKPYAFYLGPVQGRWRLVEFGADAE